LAAYSPLEHVIPGFGLNPQGHSVFGSQTIPPISVQGLKTAGWKKQASCGRKMQSGTHSVGKLNDPAER
jgi:hypothetical protein